MRIALTDYTCRSTPGEMHFSAAPLAAVQAVIDPVSFAEICRAVCEPGQARRILHGPLRACAIADRAAVPIPFSYFD